MNFGLFDTFFEDIAGRGIVAPCCFVLARHGEVADTLHVSNNSREIVHIATVAVGTGLQIAFVDVAAVVADGVWDVECEVVAPFSGGYTKNLAILNLTEMLGEIGVESRTAREVLDIFLTVKAKFVEKIERFVFNTIKVAVVAVARYLITVFTVPLGVFHANIFGRNHFAVEENVFGTILLVISFNETENLLHERHILGVDRKSVV